MSKSRSGKTPSSNANAPPATTQNAIIPGKFFESDWLELLEIEDDENFISDLIDEITDAACNQVYDNIITSRVHPHTVLAVRELLLDIIDWNFLENDPGESGTDVKLSWVEDDEPAECDIDNWAQGAVPKKEFVALDKIQEEKDTVVDTLITDMANLNTDENVLEHIINDESVNDSFIETDVTEKIADLTIDDSDSLEDSTNDQSEEFVLDHINSEEIKYEAEKPKIKKKSKKYYPHVGSLPMFEKISLDSVTDLRPKPGTKTSSDPSIQYLVKSQYGRASGPKEIVYDDKGHVVKVQKLNVAHFPKHRVPVKYSIVDHPEIETTKQHKISSKNIKQTAENSIRNRNRINARTLLQKIQPSTSLASTGLSDYYGNYSDHMQYTLQPRSPLPPLMVDSINVADGVTIRQGGLSKQVVKKATQETSVGKHTMHPISNSTKNKILEVKDIVLEKSPTFRHVAVPGM